MKSWILSSRKLLDSNRLSDSIIFSYLKNVAYFKVKGEPPSSDFMHISADVISF